MNLVIRDGSGSVRLALWDLEAIKAEEGGVEKGDEVEVLNAMVKAGLGGPELHLGMTGSIKRVKREEARRFAKVNELREGVESDVLVRVLEVGRRTEFEREGKKSSVAWCLVGDESGTIRLVMWEPVSAVVEKMKKNDVAKVEGGVARKGLEGNLELHVGWDGRVLLNLKGMEAAPREMTRGALPRKIGELVEGDLAEVRAKLSRILAVRDSEGGRYADALFSDDSGEMKAELHGKGVLKLLGLKALAEDIASSTVLKLKGKELVGKEYYLTGKLAGRVFKVEDAAPAA